MQIKLAVLPQCKVITLFQKTGSKVETYAKVKSLIENPNYQSQRQKYLQNLTDDMIDAPIIEIIKGFNELPFCFTLQS